MKKILGLIIFIIGILLALVILISAGLNNDVQINSLGALVIFDVVIIFVGYKLHKFGIKKEKVGEEK